MVAGTTARSLRGRRSHRWNAGTSRRGAVARSLGGGWEGLLLRRSDGPVVFHVPGFCPGGATENSPAIDRWDTGRASSRRPVGTSVRCLCCRLSVPTGLRVGVTAGHPAMNRRATFRRFLGTTQAEAGHVRDTPYPLHRAPPKLSCARYPTCEEKVISQPTQVMIPSSICSRTAGPPRGCSGGPGTHRDRA